jgi:hypothetical protein
LVAKFLKKIFSVSYQEGPSSRPSSAEVNAFHFQSTAKRRGLPARHANAPIDPPDCVCGLSANAADSPAIDYKLSLL